MAQLAVADVVADAAEAQLVLHVEDGLRQMLGIFAAGAQHVERDALRGLLPDAGQALEFGDEARQRFGEIGHRLRTCPGGRPMPPSMPPIFCWISSSTFLTASLHAATPCPAASRRRRPLRGRSSRASRFFWPSIFTVTMPPPAVASTLICAISCCSFSCICCAWCIICCMLPGSFTCLLLQISNFADLAAEDFAEALHFRIGQRAAGGFVLRVVCGGVAPSGAAGAAGFARRSP